jgi:hypothetical protein
MENQMDKATDTKAEAYSVKKYGSYRDEIINAYEAGEKGAAMTSKVGKPREFWIENKANEYTDNQFWASETMNYDTDIPVIEKTPEVVRKLECFDELVESCWLLLDYGHDLKEKKREEIKALLAKAKGE